MHIESAFKSAEALSTDQVNRVGKYSQKFKNQLKQEHSNKIKQKSCYFCGSEIKIAIRDHLKQSSSSSCLPIGELSPHRVLLHFLGNIRK